jgi:hypothetical protein
VETVAAEEGASMVVVVLVVGSTVAGLVVAL